MNASAPSSSSYGNGGEHVFGSQSMETGHFAIRQLRPHLAANRAAAHIPRRRRRPGRRGPRTIALEPGPVIRRATDSAGRARVQGARRRGNWPPPSSMISGTAASPPGGAGLSSCSAAYIAHGRRVPKDARPGLDLARNRMSIAFGRRAHESVLRIVGNCRVAPRERGPHRAARRHHRIARRRGGCSFRRAEVAQSFGCGRTRGMPRAYRYVRACSNGTG